MTTLRDLLYLDSREPSVSLSLAGRSCNEVLRVRRASAYGSDGITSGTVVLRSPPVTPEQGQSVTWAWGYNGLHVPGFTGYVVNVEKISYPDTWQLDVRDVLWLASREQRPIATVPLNSIEAGAAITYILATYAGLTRLSLPTIPRPSGGAWTLGQLTPVSWSKTTALSACQDICKAAGYWLYADFGGIVRAAQIERRPSTSAAWEFLDGRDFLDDSPPQRRRDGGQCRNRVTVRGANTGVQGAQLYDTYLATHALYSGVVAEEEYSSSLLEDIADVTATAERITGLLNRKPDVATFGALFNPYVAMAQTIGIRDPYIGLSSTKTYFVYGLDVDMDCERGAARMSITADGGLGSAGYTQLPPPTAVAAYRLMRETLVAGSVVEVFLDGSGSTSATGEVVVWAWATTTATHGSTPTTATGAKATFVYPAATATADITLTVTDTSSKTDVLTLSIALAGDEVTVPSARTIALALGSARAVTPDGGATWNVTATGDSTLVPESSDQAIVTTTGTGGTSLVSTRDAGASWTAGAALGGAATAMSHTPGTTRLWIAVGAALYLSTDDGATKALWGTLPASVSAALEDPAVPNSIFALAGANLYHSTLPTPGSAGWVVLYAGPTGATARHLARGESGATTLVCYTGTFTGSPVHRVEGPISVVWPLGTSPDVTQVRAIALSPDEQTCYAWDSEGRGWAIDTATGVAAAITATLSAGETAQHALHDPDDTIIYLATFGATAGTTYKYLPQADWLTPFYAPASGQQAHRVGLAASASVAGRVYVPTYGNSPGGVWQWLDGTWTLFSSGLPSGMYWSWIAAYPFDSNHLLLIGNSAATAGRRIVSGQVVRVDGGPIAYRSTDGGATWEALTLTTSLSDTALFVVSEANMTASDAAPEWLIVGWRYDSNQTAVWRITATGTTFAETATLSGHYETAGPGQGRDYVLSDKATNKVVVLSDANAISTPAGAAPGAVVSYIRQAGAGAALIASLAGTLVLTSDYRAAQPVMLTSGALGYYGAALTDGTLLMSTTASGVSAFAGAFAGDPASTTETLAGVAVVNVRTDAQSRTVAAALTTSSIAVRDSSGAWTVAALPPGCSPGDGLEIVA